MHSNYGKLVFTSSLEGDTKKRYVQNKFFNWSKFVNYFNIHVDSAAIWEPSILESSPFKLGHTVDGSVHIWVHWRIPLVQIRCTGDGTQHIHNIYLEEIKVLIHRFLQSSISFFDHGVQVSAYLGRLGSPHSALWIMG